MEHLEAHRNFFARLIAANIGIGNPEHPVVKAFASVPREHFLGPGPWQVFTAAGYIATPNNNAAFVYQDVVIALDRDKQLNNGQPLLHAASLAALAAKPGETVIHVGAGTGYYTALLATMVGDQGRVFAYEIDQELAARAVLNLGYMSNVTVIAGNASEGPLPQCDAIYVNAGATGPQDCWLDSLKSGGRLLLPLTPAEVSGRPAPGMMLLITYAAERNFRARFVCQAAFTPCIGARDTDTAEKLTVAFARGDARTVRSLRREGTPDETCWCSGQRWWLSTAAPAAP